MKGFLLAVVVFVGLGVALSQTPTTTINGVPPPFLFTGSAVSQLGNIFTFTLGSGTFVALTGDAQSTANGGATTVIGLKSVPFCNGYTPVSGQLLLYSTSLVPNPCYTATLALQNGTTATTQTANDNSTKVATTGYADTNIVKRVSCGTGTTCTQTVLSKPLLDVYGTVSLSGGTGMVTGLPAFSSTTTSQCSCEDTSAPLQACSAVLATTTSITANGNTNDVVKWHCFGN